MDASYSPTTRNSRPRLLRGQVLQRSSRQVYFTRLVREAAAADPLCRPGQSSNAKPDSYVINNPLNRTDPLGHNWFLIDDEWEWHKGKTYTRTDSQGNQQNYTSKYTGLLVAERTGTNAKGATTFKYTLYDQNKVVGTGSGFSGGRDEAGGFHNPIRDGNYQILTAHDPTKPTAPQPGDPDNNPPVSYRIQEIDRTLNGYAEEVYQAYGPIRARLNPLNGPDVGDYFHGQFNGRGWTHGCLCYGTDPRMINYMWNAMPNTWVGVSVDVPVVKP